jgi:hypothetical protein
MLHPRLPMPLILTVDGPEHNSTFVRLKYPFLPMMPPQEEASAVTENCFSDWIGLGQLRLHGDIEVSFHWLFEMIVAQSKTEVKQ